MECAATSSYNNRYSLQRGTDRLRDALVSESSIAGRIYV